MMSDGTLLRCFFKMYGCVLTYGAGIVFGTFCPSGPFPLRFGRTSPGFCGSLLRLLKREAMPLTLPLTPLANGAGGGCLKAEPEGGRFVLKEGDGEDWWEWTPLVCTAGSGGRFIFWWGAEGLLATAVAMMRSVVEGGDVARLRRVKLWRAT